MRHWRPISRRAALRDLGALGAAVALGEPHGAFPHADGEVRPVPPNLVLFLVDDMGWQDTSVPFHSSPTPFNDRYHTPSMERLADGGVCFTQAYACCVCSPSRVSLMTGMNAARHRVTNWTLWKDRATDGAQGELMLPEWNVNGIAPLGGDPRAVHARCLPAILRHRGYRTIHVGKAHFGAVGTPGADPRSLGFDVNIAGHAAGGPGSYLGTQNFSGRWRGAEAVWDVPGLEHYHGQDIFLTEALTLEAIREMDAAVRRRQPFFLYLSHYAVHVPFADDPRFVGKYDRAGLDHTEAQYAALLEGMDQSLGDILDRLRYHGIEQNTVVLFMSDNGGLSAYGRGGEPHTHNRPLSSGKGSAHEGGIRVPMIVSWPGIVRPGTTCAHPVIIEDFYPTLLELAGVPEITSPDAQSVVPLLRGEAPGTGSRALHWHYPNCWGPPGPGIGASSTIRRGDWKLIYYHADQSYELFNIAEDIGEERNRARSEPHRVSELADALRDHLLAVDAQMPSLRSTGEPVPLPGESVP
ncbi:MAG TPA: sulfatase [Armatimonadota bacterium]|mgnify:CR=1 FL=1|nr:sulfatase [Armatimonadota bacterium]